MDEKVGPYKIVANTEGSHGKVKSYSIAVDSSSYVQGRYLKVVVPDAGDAQMARQVCNLLNKNWKEHQEVTNDETAGADGSGLDGDAE